MSGTKRGQGAFEYILMLSGVLLIVILIIFILQGTLSGTNNTMAAQQGTFSNTVTAEFVAPYTANLIVTSKTGNLVGATYPCCANGVGCASGITTACNPTLLTCPSGQFDKKTGRCA